MQSVLSLLTGVVMIALVYGLSFIPSATLAPPDDIGMADDEAAAPDAENKASEARSQADDAAA